MFGVPWRIRYHVGYVATSDKAAVPKVHFRPNRRVDLGEVMIKPHEHRRIRPWLAASYYPLYMCSKEEPWLVVVETSEPIGHASVSIGDWSPKAARVCGKQLGPDNHAMASTHGDPPNRYACDSAPGIANSPRPHLTTVQRHVALHLVGREA